MAPAIDFQPITEGDVPMLWEWYQRPHVARWFAPWTPATYQGFVEETGRMITGVDPQRGFLVVVDGVPAGYIQGYRLDQEPEMAGPIALGEDAVAADVFLAEAAGTGRGVGPRVVGLFYVGMMDETGLDVGIIDPEVENARAIRAYEKAGFSFLREVDTGGRMNEHIMLARRADLEAALARAWG
jgi:aminoglycoside 6'-N-acetyltransferase